MNDNEVSELTNLVKSLLAEQEQLKLKLQEQSDELQNFKDRPSSQKPLKSVSERTRKET